MRIEKRVRGILKQGMFGGEPLLDPPGDKSEYLEATWAIMFHEEILSLEEDARNDFLNGFEKTLADAVGDVIGRPAQDVTVEYKGTAGRGHAFYIGVDLDKQYGEAQLEEFAERIWSLLNGQMEEAGVTGAEEIPV